MVTPSAERTGTGQQEGDRPSDERRRGIDGRVVTASDTRTPSRLLHGACWRSADHGGGCDIETIAVATAAARARDFDPNVEARAE